MKLTRLALLAAGFSLIGACSILPKSEPSDVYRLPSAQVPASASSAAPQQWSLRLNKLQASEALNRPSIAVIPQGDVISSYKGSRWSDPAPVLVRNHLRRLGLPASPADIAGARMDARTLIGHMAQDKKVKDGRITFVLARGIGGQDRAGDRVGFLGLNSPDFYFALIASAVARASSSRRSKRSRCMTRARPNW